MTGLSAAMPADDAPCWHWLQFRSCTAMRKWHSHQSQQQHCHTTHQQRLLVPGRDCCSSARPCSACSSRLGTRVLLLHGLARTLERSGVHAVSQLNSRVCERDVSDTSTSRCSLKESLVFPAWPACSICLAGFASSNLLCAACPALLAVHLLSSKGDRYMVFSDPTRPADPRCVNMLS